MEQGRDPCGPGQDISAGACERILKTPGRQQYSIDHQHGTVLT